MNEATRLGAPLTHVQRELVAERMRGIRYLVGELPSAVEVALVKLLSKDNRCRDEISDGAKDVLTPGSGVKRRR